MRIQHNIMAMNAYRNYNANTSALSKNLEKLSSGYKINRAGDDAAGLAISEKMRAQITGLDAAQKNVKDGISLVKTAEGAMQEVQDMLNRMVYLAEQSANGTYDNEVDRANLQKEVDQLRSEIDRIADSANFNGINLLDGSMEKGAVRGAEYTKLDSSEIADMMKAAGFGTTQGAIEAGKTVLEADGADAQKASFSVKLDNLNVAGDDTLNLEIGSGGNKVTLSVDVKAGMTAADIATAIAEKYATQSFTDDQNVSMDFKVKADGNSLQFTGTETKAFNPPTTVSYSLTNTGMNPEDDITVKDTEITLSASPYKTTGSGKDATTALASAPLEDAAASKTGALDLKLAAAVTGTADFKEIRDFANKNGLTGDVSVKFDGSTANLCIGDTVVATGSVGTIAAGTSSTATGTAGVTFTQASGFEGSFTATKYNLTLTSTGEVAVAGTELDGKTVNLGQTIGEDTALDGKFVGDAALKDTLKTLFPNLDGEATGSVNLKYIAKEYEADGTTVKAGTDVWQLTADGQDPVTVSVDATGTPGKLTVTGPGGEAIGVYDLTGVDATKAANITEADMQRVFANGVNIAKMGKDPAVTGTLNGAVQNIQVGDAGGGNRLANATLDLSKYMQQDGNKITLGDTTYTVALGADSKFKDAKNVIDLTDMNLKEGTFDAKIAATRLTTVAKENNGTFSVGHDNKGNTTIQQLSSVKESTDMSDVDKFASFIKIEEAKAGSLENVSTAQGLTLQIGDTSDTYNQLAVSIGDMHVSALGIDAIDISTQKGAQDAVDVIRNAINQVSSVRGDLGATQNRLEHTANNLSVMAENIQDAESTIRDTDVAEEMMAYTKNNILIQSAQAMLAQANAVPQGVLQLLG